MASQLSLEDFASQYPDHTFMADAFGGGGGSALGGRKPDIEPSLMSYRVEPTRELIYTAGDSEPFKSLIEFVGGMIMGNWDLEVRAVPKV